MSRHPGYPFEPKSTAYVKPGDFWAIPTRSGDRYCCGQVLSISTHLTASRFLIVGLLDWCQMQLPTGDSITGAAVLDFGVAHVKTVRETGGHLLGHGAVPVVAGTDDPNLTTWGYMFIERLAHRHFGRHFLQEPGHTAKQPAEPYPLTAVADAQPEPGFRAE
ncbi:hypothetical protein AB0K00_42685 [Dactylosporangium sp. NPDC049525]|uniref:hypothetical protein n=1 Tax=Dactylosporangium sp. NPDC049525 TaxID=3154730 RepID=UPI0034451BFC